MAGAQKTFAEGQSGSRPFTHIANMHRYPPRWALAPLYELWYILWFHETSDMLNNTQWACEVPGFGTISSRFQILSSWTETSQPRTEADLFLTQRLGTAQIPRDTKKSSLNLCTESSQLKSQTFKHNRDHNHTHCDKDPLSRPKFSIQKKWELCRYFTSWRLTPKESDTYQPNTNPLGSIFSVLSIVLVCAFLFNTE